MGKKKITIQENTPTHLALRARSQSLRRGFVSALQLTAEEKEMPFQYQNAASSLPYNRAPTWARACKSDVDITI